MRTKLITFVTVSFFLLWFSVLCASEDILTAVRDPAITDKITVDSVNLSGKDFFRSYMSRIPEERATAELYLLGVMDATEGGLWCDYRTFKTITLRERVFLEFKEMDVAKLNERASKIVEEILSRRYPCKKDK